MHPCCCKWKNFILFYDWEVFHCIYLPLFYSSVDGHLGCFHIWAIANNAAMNIGICVSFLISVLCIFDYIARNTIVVSYGSSIFEFFEKLSHHFPQWLHQFTLLPIMYRGSLYPTLSQTFVFCFLFDGSHSNRYEIVPYHGFNVHFPDNYWCWASFCVPVRHLHFFGEKNIYLVLLFIFLVGLFAFDVELYDLFIYVEH